MAQRLILPINNPCLTASFKSKGYSMKFGVPHYGCDMVADTTTLFACGNGEVVCAGKDSVVGNTLCIIYQDVWVPARKACLDLAVRYFHMADIRVKVGDKVTKDTIVGHYGATGKYVNGAHLHIEVDTDAKNWQGVPGLSPSKSTFYYAGGDTMINPCQVLFSFQGDGQTMRYSKAAYNGQPYAVQGGFGATNQLVYTPAKQETPAPDWEAKYLAEQKAHSTTKQELAKAKAALAEETAQKKKAEEIICQVQKLVG